MTSIPDIDRAVAGLRCRDVLAFLGDYLDGDLPADSVARVEAHLMGCDYCEKFGGEYKSLVGALRRQLRRPSEAGLRERLAHRMRELWEAEDS